MSDTKITGKPRGRPRSFDTEQALAKAEALFHARGYDAVSVAALAEELGINPPSFYAAFGNKAGLFEQVLERYAQSALPIDTILQPGRDMTEALTELLETAARTYSAEPAARGCLVLETSRTADAGCTAAAGIYRNATRERIAAFVAASLPDHAERLADLVDVLLSGLSARAREGWDGARLIEAARIAAMAIPATLGR